MTTKLQILINPLTINPLKEIALMMNNQEIIESSMDIELDNLRKTMIMHQQIFKQQVHELHRLYNLQKKLMQELGFQASFTATRSDDPRDPSGCCSRDSSKMPIKFDLERRPDNIHLFQDEKDLEKIDEENEVEVELTLSIGHCPRKPKSRDFDQTNRVGEIGSPSSVKINEGPKWLLKDLSLNRT